MEISGYLRQRLEAQYGDTVTMDIVRDGYDAPRRTTLRVNRLKGTREEVTEALAEAGMPFEQVSWFGDAFALEPGQEEAVRTLPLYGQGKIYLQSLSSMIPPLLLGAQAGENVLDMAAAPGGKTTEIASLTGDLALITACERSAPRLARMKANLERQGAGRVTAMNMDARDLSDYYSFDRVLLDAPCSGSGTVSRDSRGRFDEALLRRNAALQRALLAKAVRLTKKGGTIVYSTCSILREENEAVVSDALRRGGCRLLPVDKTDMAEIPRLPCTLPGALLIRPTARYEGFFAAVLVRE